MQPLSTAVSPRRFTNSWCSCLHADAFLHSVASPFHCFVTTVMADCLLGVSVRPQGLLCCSCVVECVQTLLASFLQLAVRMTTCWTDCWKSYAATGLHHNMHLDLPIKLLCSYITHGPIRHCSHEGTRWHACISSIRPHLRFSTAMLNTSQQPACTGIRCIGLVWVHAESFLRWVASPFHSCVTKNSP